MNLVLGSFIGLFTLPIMLLTLGLFGLEINALMFRRAAWWSDYPTCSGIGAAFFAAVLITVFTWFPPLTPLGRDSRKGSRHARS